MRRKSVFWKILTIAVIVAVGLSVGVFVYASNPDDSVYDAEPITAVDPAIQKSMEEAALYEETPRLNVSDDQYVAEGDKSEYLNNNPQPIFQAVPEADQYFDINTRIDEEYLASVGAAVKLKEVMSYEAFLENFNEEALTAIAPDCMVYVLQVHYPNGYETRRGLYLDAVVTGLYDAATGYYHGFSLTGQCENINAPGE
ncbi:MAG: hypothetical protein LBT44_02920 [Clostridiales bacterium]|jgi:hypothetical protein|nr:hypothetical protein [Clostridiales bacterium]